MAQQDFTIADVLAWARTKPADEAYNYSDPANCALCHFLRDTGRTHRPLVTPYCDGDTAENFGWSTLGEPHSTRTPYDPALEPPLKEGRTFGGLVVMLERIAPLTTISMNDWLTIEAYLTDIEAVAVSA